MLVPNFLHSLAPIVSGVSYRFCGIARLCSVFCSWGFARMFLVLLDFSVMLNLLFAGLLIGSAGLLGHILPLLHGATRLDWARVGAIPISTSNPSPQQIPLRSAPPHSIPLRFKSMLLQSPFKSAHQSPLLLIRPMSVPLQSPHQIKLHIRSHPAPLRPTPCESTQVDPIPLPTTLPFRD